MKRECASMVKNRWRQQLVTSIHTCACCFWQVCIMVIWNQSFICGTVSEGDHCSQQQWHVIDFRVTRVMRFDSEETRLKCREQDRMAPITEIHETFIIIRSSYKPGTQLCVDEQLVIYRGRCPFKVFIPRKPGKYGMKVWLCCDIDTLYVCNLELCSGKQGHSPEVDQATRVVMQLLCGAGWK